MLPVVLHVSTWVCHGALLACVLCLCSGACAASCQTCTGSAATQCASCKSGFNFDASLFTCTACTSPRCDACGSDPATCTTCKSGFVAAANGGGDCVCANGGLLKEDGTGMTCIAAGSCPATGYFVSGTDCLKCHSSCATCNGATATSCLSCKAGDYWDPIAHSCGSTCPAGYGKNTATSSCDLCDSSCDDCSALGPNACTKCKTSNGVTAYLHLGSSGTSGSCYVCDGSCGSSCSGTTATDCLSCKAGDYLDPIAHSCGSTCPAGYWKNTATTTCDACDSSCATCSGAGPSQCLSCNRKGAKPYLDGSVCVAACSTASYVDAAGLCQRCDASCKTCVGAGPAKCATCSSDAFFTASAGTCTTCDASCATCDGATVNNCLTCANSLYVVHKPYGSSGASGVCDIPCHAACAGLCTASDSPTACREVDPNDITKRCTSDWVASINAERMGCESTFACV